MWVVDTEDDSKGTLIMVNGYDGRDHVTFQGVDAGEAWERWADDHGIRTVYAVNAIYDALNIHKGDRLRGLKFRCSRSRYLEIRAGGLRYINTLNQIPASVKKMGDALGYPKLPFDPYSVEYCRRDCEVTWKYLSKTMATYERLGIPWALTVGSSAVKWYEKKGGYLPYVKDSVLAPLLPPRLKSKIGIPAHGGNRKYSAWDFFQLFWREGLYGGRVEVFDMNRFPKVEYCDINSMYPSVMRGGSWPDPAWPRAGANLDREGFTRARVRVPHQDIPPLPVRFRERMIFPVGNLEGTWTNNELRYAMEKCGVVLEKVLDGVSYPALRRSPFTEFVDDTYNGRQAARDLIERQVFKDVGNNLYGKFSTGGMVPDLVPYNPNDQNSIDWNLQDLQLFPRAGFAKFEKWVGVPRYSHVVWGAYVTAYARIRLHQGLISVEYPIYCDTDSIASLIARGLLISGNLGDWKKEIVDGGFQAWGPKLYRKGTEFRAKGVPMAKAQEYIERGRTTWEAPVTLMESFRTNAGYGPNYWVTKERKRRATMAKRRVLKDGRTEPYDVFCDGISEPEILNYNVGRLNNELFE